VRPFVPYERVEGEGEGLPAIIPLQSGHSVGLNPEKENIMIPENIVSRVGRLIAGIAHVAIDKAEGSNRLAVVQQAIREIEDAEATAQADLAQARATEYRINARHGELDAELTTLAGKIRTALAEKRDDLARSGIARQLDLEAQQEVLAKALAENNEAIAANLTALQAVRSALEDAESRLSDLRKSEAAAPTQGAMNGARPMPGSTEKAERANRAIARTTGVPAGTAPTADIAELSQLHRDKQIAERLAKLKSQA
jgi:phage shock protein A